MGQTAFYFNIHVLYFIEPKQDVENYLYFNLWLIFSLAFLVNVNVLHHQSS